MDGIVRAWMKKNNETTTGLKNLRPIYFSSPWYDNTDMSLGHTYTRRAHTHTQLSVTWTHKNQKSCLGNSKVQGSSNLRFQGLAFSGRIWIFLNDRWRVPRLFVPNGCVENGLPKNGESRFGIYFFCKVLEEMNFSAVIFP